MDLPIRPEPARAAPTTGAATRPGAGAGTGQAVLVAGATVDVQVLAALQDGRFLLSLAGREFPAASDSPLQPGTSVRLKVAAAGLDGVVLRLAEGASAETSLPAQRLAAAGLPATDAARQVLAAFEEAGAPLEPQRLQQALQAVLQAPPAAQATVAVASALLARAQLPSTPALVALAVRAAAGGLPDLGTAAQDLADAARSVLVQEDSRTDGRRMASAAPPAATAPPTGAGAAAQPVPAARIATTVAAAPASPVASGQRPAAGAPAADPIHAPAPGGQRPTGSGQPPATVDQPVTRTAATGPPAARPAPIAAPAPSPPASGAQAPQSAASAGEPAGIPPAPAAPSPAVPMPDAAPRTPATSAMAMPAVPTDVAPAQAPPAAVRVPAVPLPTPAALAPPVDASPQPTARAPVIIASAATDPVRVARTGNGQLRPTPVATPLAGVPPTTPAPSQPTGINPPAPSQPTGINPPAAALPVPLPTSTPRPTAVAARAGTTATAPPPPGATTQLAPRTTAPIDPVAPSDARASPASLPAPAARTATAAANPPIVAGARPLPTGERGLALRMLAELVVPDPEREGAAGVVRALQLAGVRIAIATTDATIPAPQTPPAASPGTPPAPADPAPAPALARQAANAAAPPPHQQRDDAPPPPPPPAGGDFGGVAARAAREQLADQVFKPQQLADYDRVVPLPLAAQQVPTPARLAVATRSAGAGGPSATFLRVDAELTRLGPLSVRMSGLSGGPLAITIVASPAAGPLLAADLPELVADLERAGVDAGVRIAVGDPTHG